MNYAKKIVTDLLQLANIHINGNAPCDIQVHDERFYGEVLQKGALGLGESYMDNDWDCERIDDFFDRVLLANLEKKIKKSKQLLFKIILARLLNLQTKERSLVVGKKHYDLGHSLFQYMLDSHMNYSCGYWKNARNLEEAQLAKLELICQKLLLKPGMRLLDIGCGWGALARYAAKHYGVSVVGVTISEQQYHYAKDICRDFPIEIRMQDYRDIQNEHFDRIVSIGMFEHVGHHNYSTYMKKIYDCLQPDGLFLLHTIGDNITEVSNEWITKYIFPYGMLPSIRLIGKAIEGLFVMEDWHNFGADYDKTLISWHENFETHWDQLKTHYDERFRRMWNYYLLSSAGAFRARSIQLWQIVLSKYGVRHGYSAPR